MIDKLYLYSTDWGDGPELIGTIVKSGEEYTFSYATPDDVKWYQIIKPYKGIKSMILTRLNHCSGG